MDHLYAGTDDVSLEDLNAERDRGRSTGKVLTRGLLAAFVVAFGIQIYQGVQSGLPDIGWMSILYGAAWLWVAVEIGYVLIGLLGSPFQLRRWIRDGVPLSEVPDRWATFARALSLGEVRFRFDGGDHAGAAIPLPRVGLCILGAPSLGRLPVAERDAIVAHEMAHLTGGWTLRIASLVTLLANVCLRIVPLALLLILLPAGMRSTILTVVVAAVGVGSVAAFVKRREEYRADRLAAQLTSAETFARALIQVERLQKESTRLGPLARLVYYGFYPVFWLLRTHPSVKSRLTRLGVRIDEITPAPLPELSVGEKVRFWFRPEEAFRRMPEPDPVPWPLG